MTERLLSAIGARFPLNETDDNTDPAVHPENEAKKACGQQDLNQFAVR